MSNDNWRRIGAARVAQIERVNGERREMPAEAHHLVPPTVVRVSNIPPTRDEKALLLRCEQLERIIADQKAVIADLRAQLRAPAGLSFGSRPVLTSKQAADVLERSVSTVSRYCTSGHLASVRINGELFVFADQPLAPKERKRK
jgi:hypothetical protein